MRRPCTPFLAPALVMLGTPIAAAAADGRESRPTPPVPVVGGEEAAVCAWPSVGALLNGDAVNCTATLVHPQVVLTAAHCVDPYFSGSEPTALAFGENGAAPTGTVGITDCVWHPGWTYSPPNELEKDLAFCILDAPIEGLPLIPVLAGCEAETLQAGSSITIVGYGATKSTLVSGNNFQLEGVGLKRTLQMSVQEVTDNGEILLQTPTGGGCNGDSGGPAMIQLGDGSWRVVGAASRRAVEDSWMPQVGDALCPEGLGLFYGLYHLEMEWFESATGFDLTPCHDAMGTWDPGSGCTAFPIDPGAGGGDWSLACQPAEVGGQPGSCEELPPGGSTGGTGPGTGGSTGGQDDSGGGEGGTAGTSGVGSGTTGDDDSATGTTDASAGSEGVLDRDSGGCGCTSRSPGGWLGIFVALLGAFRRRRL